MQKWRNLAISGHTILNTDLFNRRLQGVQGNADIIPVLFGPDWLMRVYHDIPAENILRKELIQEIEDFYPHVDFCYVGDITMFGNLSGE